MTNKLIRSFVAFIVLAALGLSTIPAAPAGASTQDGSTPALTDDSPSAQITRLYEAFFLRTPPQADRMFWVGRLNGGQTLASIAEDFASSPEFQATYGALDNEAFVALVYQNVLDRNPDDNGFWAGELDAGRRTRGTVMIGFSEGTEFRQVLLDRYDDSAIFRLYCAYFLREPDAGGRAFWKEQAANGVSITSIADTFALVPEFQTLYGTNVSNEAFVDQVYLNVLDRPRDASETFWLEKLNSGEFSRGRVMIGFSEAPEYKDRFTGPGCPMNTVPPEAPQAADDVATVTINAVVSIPVLDNDTTNGAAVTNVSTPTGGSAVLNGVNIDYTAPAAAGSYTFTYTLTNATGSDNATVTVTVNPPGGPVAVADDDLEAGYETALEIDVTSNDTLNGATLSDVGSNDPGFDDLQAVRLTPGGPTTEVVGSVAITGTTVTFTPNSDFAGDATFFYTVCNVTGCSTAQVTVDVAVRELAQVDCTIFINPPVVEDAGAVPPIAARNTFILFLRSGGCFQPYENMPGGSGSVTLEYSDVTLTTNGGTPVPVTPTANGEIQFDVAIDPTDFSQGDTVVLTGTLTLKDGTRVLMTNTGFTGTWQVSASGPWVGQSGSQAGVVLLVDPITGNDIP